MRTEKSILNVSTNFFIYAFRSVMMFIVRTVFIKVLGEEYLGLDGLFTNILLMLSITELGVSNAINFSLYEPLAKKDYKKVSSLMSFYKKAYKIIGTLVIILGLIIMLFLDEIVTTDIPDINIYFIYLIYLFDTANLYFISYKETLIIADQNNYQLVKYNFITYLAMYILQIIALIVTHSFVLYLFIKIFVMLINRICINHFISKKYKEINFNSTEKVNKEDLKIIKTNIKGMFFHKIGYYCINGTDNIIISRFLSITAVGIYTNYLSLITMTNTILSSLYKGITASFGNLIALENKKTQEQIFQKTNFAGHIIYSFVTSAFIVLINFFVTLWVGKNYLLNSSVVFVICLNFYIDGMRQSIDSIKDAAGVYNQDKYIPIIQSIVNIIISVVLVQYIGMLGVVLGTLISNLVLPCWNRPYIIYKYVFKTSPKNYYINYIKNFIVMLFTTGIILFIMNKLNLAMTLINFILSIIIFSVLFIAIYSIIYFKNENYRFYIKLVLSKLKKATH